MNRGTFAAIKPTSTFNEEKALKTRDLPETVVCIEPGFDHDVLQKFGYKFGNTYLRGSIGGTKFVGWNGVGIENSSSHGILEEALRLNASCLSLFSKIIFIKDHVTCQV